MVLITKSKGLKRLSKQEWMRLELPYGRWTCPDGREVLFDRWYQPIWQRMPGETATAADREERVGFTREEWFYTDADTPWRSKAGLARCMAVLHDWGVPEPVASTLRFKPRSAAHEMWRGPVIAA